MMSVLVFANVCECPNMCSLEHKQNMHTLVYAYVPEKSVWPLKIVGKFGGYSFSSMHAVFLQQYLCS